MHAMCVCNNCPVVIQKVQKFIINFYDPFLSILQLYSYLTASALRCVLGTRMDSLVSLLRLSPLLKTVMHYILVLTYLSLEREGQQAL